jgi:hypothetical protein
MYDAFTITIAVLIICPTLVPDLAHKFERRFLKR